MIAGPNLRAKTALEADRSRTVCLVACGGTLPREIADAIIRSGRRLHVLALDGTTDADFSDCDVTRLPVYKYGAAIKALHAAGVKDVLMVGRMTRPKLRDARPDFGFLGALPLVLKVYRAGGDDALLRAVVQLFEPHGFRVIGVGDVAPELLVGDGVVAGSAPSLEDKSDIDKGMALIDALGRFDIGQGAIVAGGEILAIEGAEGTDRMIARVAARRAGSGVRTGVLIKRPKPAQDMRVDLPTIGPGTVDSIVAAGLSGIAAEAGLVIAAERATMVSRARASGVFVFGVTANKVRSGNRPADQLSSRNLDELDALPKRLRADAALGIAVMRALADFKTGTALVTRRDRVISIGAGEPAMEVIQRTYGRKTGRLRPRRGVAVVANGQDVDASLVVAAFAIGLGAIVTLTGVVSRDAEDVARRSGLALLKLLPDADSARP